MRLFRKFLFLISAAMIGAGTNAQAPEPYPLDYWALREVINNVQVSPDGKYLGLMKIPSKDGDPIIEIHETADLGKEPFRLNADPMEITNFFWVSDKKLIFSLRQRVRDRIEGFNRGVYESRIALLDVERQQIRRFDEVGPAIENLLPDQPNKVIISFAEGGGDGPGSRVSAAFRPRAYWEFDLDRGSKRLLIRGKTSVGNITFDAAGNPWLARGYDVATRDFVLYFRRPEESSWQEFYRINEDDFESTFVGVLEQDDAAPDHALMLAHNGHDKLGLWSYDMANRKFGELIYRRNDVDVLGIRRHSNFWTYPGQATAVSYFTDKVHYEYFDETEGAMYQQLEGLIPHAHLLNVVSRSRAGDTMVIRNMGPRDPGTYYLLHNGQLQTVGSTQPLLESENLADLRYITYKARDGKTIPAFLTIPSGQPPFPLVVMPHGGPFVQEFVIYDEWAQMLANNGYLVLQPQYRGSHGYGMDFYTTAFVEGGQGGRKMQDDKDDGALHLVEEGLADKDRMAMFGWSYGGYAAVMAATRTPQIYRCVIAAAAVTDNNLQVNYYRWALRGAQRDEQLRMWDDSISPIEVADQVNVPMLLIHGSVDQRVPREHATNYRRRLEEHGKNFKFVELEGADHFSNTLFFDHQIKLYQSMTDFLRQDCAMQPESSNG